MVVLFGAGLSGTNPETLVASDPLLSTWNIVTPVTLITGLTNYYTTVWTVAKYTGANTVHFTPGAGTISGSTMNLAEFSGVTTIDQNILAAQQGGVTTFNSPTITPGS